MHNSCTLTWYRLLWQAWEEYVDSLIEHGVAKPNLAHWVMCYLVRLALFFLRVFEPIVRFQVGDLELWQVILACTLGPVILWFYFSLASVLLGA